MSYPNPLPAGWFTEPVRAWWPDFQSALCTPGHPLCMMGHVELMLVKRRARVAAASARAASGEARPFRFSRKEAGKASTAEMIWRHISTHGRIDENTASDMLKCKPGSFHQRVGNAIDAGVLARVMVAGRWGYELGAVKPQGVAA